MPTPTPNTAYEKTRAEILKRGPRTRILNLRNRNLTALPPEIARLTALRTIDLGNNQLTALPPEITRLTALQSLYLHNNQLTALPLEITRLTALQILFLDNNPLTTLPLEITRLAALQTLSLDNNQLTALPPEITRLIALQNLDLDNNQLTALPLEITRLTALQRLYLRHNQLTVLPAEITGLIGLRTLDLGNNQLTALPPELGALTALEKAARAAPAPYLAFGLYLEGNPLPAPYPTLIAPGQPEATINVLAYLRGEHPQHPPTEPHPTIPLPRPATIRTRTTKGRIAIDPSATPTTLPQAELNAALAALRISLKHLLADADADSGNFDRRLLNQILRAADRLPKSKITNASLFELGHLHDYLARASKTVADQWPDHLALPYATIVLNLSRTLDHCPEWQAYKSSPATTALTPDQTQQTLPIAQSLATSLRTPEATETIDPSIPAALDQFPQQHTALDEAALDLLAPDILESVNNVLKPIAEIALQANPLGEDTPRKAATAFGQQARKSVVGLAGKAGKNFAPASVKWARRYLLYYEGGSYGAAKLAAAYPQFFDWLKPILTLLPRLL